jgi:hypothetical protein
VLIAGTAGAQTIIPVDGRFPPPDGFSFQGSWKWADPAYAAYSTDGWLDRELTLTSDETQRMQRLRLVYKIENRDQFTVTFALRESAGWVTFSNSTCHRVNER